MNNAAPAISRWFIEFFMVTCLFDFLKGSQIPPTAWPFTPAVKVGFLAKEAQLCLANFLVSALNCKTCHGFKPSWLPHGKIPWRKKTAIYFAKIFQLCPAVMFPHIYIRRQATPLPASRARGPYAPEDLRSGWWNRCQVVFQPWDIPYMERESYLKSIFQTKLQSSRSLNHQLTSKW